MQNFESLYDQLKKLLVQRGYFSITRKKGKKPSYYYRRGNIIEPLSQNDFGTMCREILKEYLNQPNLNTIIETKVDTITTAYSDLLEHQMRKHLNRSVEHLNTYPQVQEIPMHQNSPCMGKAVFSVFF